MTKKQLILLLENIPDNAEILFGTYSRKKNKQIDNRTLGASPTKIIYSDFYGFAVLSNDSCNNPELTEKKHHIYQL